LSSDNVLPKFLGNNSTSSSQTFVAFKFSIFSTGRDHFFFDLSFTHLHCNNVVEDLDLYVCHVCNATLPNLANGLDRKNQADNSGILSVVGKTTISA
jgi:hypothetical protein